MDNYIIIYEKHNKETKTSLLYIEYNCENCKYFKFLDKLTRFLICGNSDVKALGEECLIRKDSLLLNMKLNLKNTQFRI